VLPAIASVAKQRRAPDERADKRNRQLASLILQTAPPANRRNVANPIVRVGLGPLTEALVGVAFPMSRGLAVSASPLRREPRATSRKWELAPRGLEKWIPDPWQIGQGVLEVPRPPVRVPQDGQQRFGATFGAKHVDEVLEGSC
jgi:hypothetical protein